jgi:spermidine/putrescine transport system ATP-binding protein
LAAGEGPDQIKQAIGIRDVSKVFGTGDTAFTAVSSANISIRENEFCTLPGPSGCGKATLLRMFAGFEISHQWLAASDR